MRMISISIVLQVEHIEAVKNVHEILAVEGVDAIFVGPYDSIASMGKPGLLGDPEVSRGYQNGCRRLPRS